MFQPPLTRAELMKASLLLLFVATAAHAQDRLPILDMHLHAWGAEDQGPPPVGMCAPFEQFPAWDPETPYGAVFGALLKSPRAPIPSGRRRPTTR